MGAMTTRRRKRFFVLAVIGVIGLGFWFTRSRDPKYQGKTLREWLRLSRNANYEDGSLAIPSSAIRAIGSNAIPILLSELQAKDSKLKEKIDGWFFTVFNLTAKGHGALERRNEAVYAFSLLGKEGESAIPELSLLITNPDEEIASCAVRALGKIESERALPVLFSCLTNQKPFIRTAGAHAFAYNPDKARLAVPLLTNVLQNSDPEFVRSCLFALSSAEEKYLPSLIPILTNQLSDADPRVRSMAAETLGSFGEAAFNSLPVLKEVYDNAPTNRRSRLGLATVRVQCEKFQGAIIRGPKNERKIALVFTGHEFSEGAETILHELSNHNGHASFFLTGTFYDDPKFKGLLQRIDLERHYLGAHSNKHLLYCSWEDRNKTLVTKAEFLTDLQVNITKAQKFRTRSEPREYFLPAFEHYNRQIADWFWQPNLINYTPGTLSHADYTGEADKNFVSSQKIFDSIVKREQEDPNGLNGFILLFHIGAGPNRKDKFHNRFGELLDYLAGKGYEFVRIDELLEPKMETNVAQRTFSGPNAPFRRR
jgi:HEAT repeat protein